jgi:4-diphosphocytidyl-2-C-methyl-D-erythritol kinase
MSGIVTEWACAKINVALHVLGRRADGMHDLDSIVAFADVADDLTVTWAEADSFALAGPGASGLPQDSSNLVLRARDLLRVERTIPPVAITLNKVLPIAAGIGGGSADAAATLRALLKLSGQLMPATQLADLALKLGADVPVCLGSRACRMRGVGEAISAIADLPAPAIVLVNPLLACSTADVFQQLGLGKGETHGTALDPAAPGLWRNDLLAPALVVQPAIRQVLDALQQVEGLSMVSMSGSGATCFGLSPSLEIAQAAAAILQARRPDWWIASGRLF